MKKLQDVRLTPLDCFMMSADRWKEVQDEVYPYGKCTAEEREECNLLSMERMIFRGLYTHAESSYRALLKAGEVTADTDKAVYFLMGMIVMVSAASSHITIDDRVSLFDHISLGDQLTD